MPLLNEQKSNEDKDLSLKWYKIRNKIKTEFGQRPDLNAMLFLIGLNEVGIIKDNWEKEEKQDLMHVAVCRLFEEDGCFKYIDTDEDGWPHYVALEAAPKIVLKEQDELLKKKIVAYFESMWDLA